MAHYKRRIKLIQPRLQLKLTGWFLSVTAIGMLLQYLLLGFFLTQLAVQLPGQGAYVVSQADKMLLQSLGLSFVLVLPLTVAVGILVTFKVAGPVYRFEKHLQSIAQGEDVGPCRIRKGDELQELCRRINAAVDALRARSTAVQANAAQALAGREVPAALPTSGSGQPQRLA
jgi:methyl-accepting chemotaxis protein